VTIVVGLVANVPRLTAVDQYTTMITLNAQNTGTGATVIDSTYYALFLLSSCLCLPTGDSVLSGLSRGHTFRYDSDTSLTQHITPILTGREHGSVDALPIDGDQNTDVLVSLVLPSHLYSSGSNTESISCKFPGNSFFVVNTREHFDPNNSFCTRFNAHGELLFSLGIEVTIPNMLRDSEFVGVALVTVQYTGLKNNPHVPRHINQIPQPIPITVTLDNHPYPQLFALRQNYPNPFNPVTTIRYELPEDTRVTVVIFDMLGEEIENLIDDVESKGFHETLWQPKNKPTGVYYCRIRANNFTDTKKMLYIR
jgi:hypothetical protein